nr:P-type DNA transfer ATPase VirB11 [Allorhizobium ampelinum]
MGKKTSFVLEQALSPLKQFLDDPTVIEISVNGPSTVFIERLGAPAMEPYSIEELTQERIEKIGQAIAGESKQFVNDQHPLLSAALPTGERVQVVLSPAAPNGGAISIRKQAVKHMTLEDYRDSGGLAAIKVSDGESSPLDEELSALLGRNDFYNFLRTAIVNQVTILISGGTSTGKTTFLNACLHCVPEHERILTLEDTLELSPPHKNVVSLLASKGNQGTSNVTIQDLLEASLRMRPDRLFVGEVRGAEVFSFIQAVNTGHPGSMCTVHADRPSAAYERLALMVMQSGMAPTLTKTELIDYIKSIIPVVVQLGREDGRRGVSGIFYARAKNDK